MFELQVDEVGSALRYATAKVNKVSRSSVVSVPTDDAWSDAPVPGVGDKPPV